MAKMPTGDATASVRKRSSLSASACSAARRSPMSAICERKYRGAPSALRTTVTSQRDPRLAAVDAQIALLGAVGRQLAGRERAHRLVVALVVGGVGDVAHADPGELSRLAAQHRRQRAVDAHEAPVGAGDRHADRRRPRRRAGSAPRRRAAPWSPGRCRCSRRSHDRCRRCPGTSASRSRASRSAARTRPRRSRRPRAPARPGAALARSSGWSTSLVGRPISSRWGRRRAARARVAVEDDPVESVTIAMSGVSSRTRAALRRCSRAGSVLCGPGTSRSSAFPARH